MRTQNEIKRTQDCPKIDTVTKDNNIINDWFSVPGSVVDLTITSDNGEDYLIRWSLPDDDGGRDVTSVNITWQLVAIGDCNDTIMVREVLNDRSVHQHSTELYVLVQRD